MTKSIELSTKVEYIKEYFKAHPEREPVNIQRIYSSPSVNKRSRYSLFIFKNGNFERSSS